jgi:hypothetical protein
MDGELAPSRTVKRALVSVVTITIALAGPVLTDVAAAQEGPPGNNGTVKVDGIPFDAHPDNEPHPGCTFEIDWYNFDANATSEVTFETQNPTSTRLVLNDTVTLDDDANEGGDQDGLDGHREYTLDFTAADYYHPQQGYHVKLTIETTWANGADVKHKVFWVSACESPTVSPTVSPSPSGSVSPSASVSPSVSPTGGTTSAGGPTVGGVSGENTSPPGGLAFTGREDLPWLIAALIAFLMAGSVALRLGSRPKSARVAEHATRSGLGK